MAADRGRRKGVGTGTTCDIILQVNDTILHGASPIPKNLLGDIQDDFPNHFIALASRPKLAGDDVQLRVWTWAGFQDLDLPVDTFMANFYGSIVCTV